jgi:heme/copper-type cytochrome/quinol oxidase subunit 3
VIAGTTAARVTIPRRVVADRGTWAMALFIATEATLFVCLFFAYFYLGQGQARWPPEPPEWRLAVVMLAVLATSSVVLHSAERSALRGRDGAARSAIVATIVMGVAFLGIQSVEYRHLLQSVQPTRDAYGSIFYAITGIHGAHVVLGLLMLGFVLMLPDLKGERKPPHRPLHNTALYWHFVDVVWFVIVMVLYLAPNLRR